MERVFVRFLSSSGGNNGGGNAESFSNVVRQNSPRQLGQNKRTFTTENMKGLLLSGSPQSTLCMVRTSCGCKQWSSYGSPKCQSLLPLVPRTWDLLHAATMEVARMQGKDEAFNHEKSLLTPPRKPPTNLDVGGFYSSQSLSHKKLKAT